MLINRIGTFFMLVGVGLIGLYIMSDIADAPTCNFLFYGFISLGLGIFLWFKNPAPPPQPSGRFRLFKSGGKKQDKKS